MFDRLLCMLNVHVWRYIPKRILHDDVDDSTHLIEFRLRMCKRCPRQEIQFIFPFIHIRTWIEIIS
jgi:hypothetical protein